MSDSRTLKRCPHCGSDDGYYIKQQVYGSIICNHKFDGSEADNTDMYATLQHKGGKIAYCMNCDKKLFKTDL